MSMDVDLSKDTLTREEKIYLLTRGREQDLKAWQDGKKAAADGSLATVELTLPEDELETDEPYTQWKLAELKAEVDARNADRPDADKIKPTGSNKEALAAALEQDDMADATV